MTEQEADAKRLNGNVIGLAISVVAVIGLAATLAT
jgi:hypothetical protein